MPINQDDPRKRFGRVIREERMKFDLSQEDFSKLCDVHRTYVGAVERGEKNISLVNMVRIAATLKTSLAKLMERAEL